ncbi:MAG: DNA gyrase inhibitor YacG [Burkholderiales bacterium]
MLTVNCPHCGKPVEWLPAQRFRPFCSERCKLLDLGAWASESYRIPVQELDDTPDDDIGSEELPGAPGH